MGQMLWDAAFDGLGLTMKSQFDMPRPAPTIIGTYGCLAFHSGLLRNGVPTAADSHPVLRVLRTETDALVLYVRVVTEAVREIKTNQREEGTPQ